MLLPLRQRKKRLANALQNQRNRRPPRKPRPSSAKPVLVRKARKAKPKKKHRRKLRRHLPKAPRKPGCPKVLNLACPLLLRRRPPNSRRWLQSARRPDLTITVLLRGCTGI